ncbi:hypothetical protein MJT46_003582 [Ovis ammon polii x Ovis aries]|nr:hypothetical protein MJT46_003582 [Ovis ammon polii x Ovis aries]
MPLGSGPWSGECEMRQRAEACCSTPEPTGCKDEVESFEPNNQERRVLVRKPRWRVIASRRRHMLPPENAFPKVCVQGRLISMFAKARPRDDCPIGAGLSAFTDLVRSAKIKAVRGGCVSVKLFFSIWRRCQDVGTRNPDQKRREQLEPAQSQAWKAAGSRAPLEAAAPRKSRKANWTGLVG